MKTELFKMLFKLKEFENAGLANIFKTTFIYINMELLKKDGIMLIMFISLPKIPSNTRKMMINDC